jgi:hypothetical protein
MHVPRIPRLTGGISGLSHLATLIRERLREVAPQAGTLFGRRDDSSPALMGAHEPTVREVATVIAATAYARARLLRQMHASGLLTQRETEQAEQLLGVAQ